MVLKPHAASKQSVQLLGPTLTLPVYGKASQTCHCKYRKLEAQLRQDECLATEVELNFSPRAPPSSVSKHSWRTIWRPYPKRRASCLRFMVVDVIGKSSLQGAARVDING